MLVMVLFWSGLILGLVGWVVSFTRPGHDKVGVVLFPITLLLAAIAAKYIGL